LIFFICSGIVNAVTSFALCVFTLRKNKSSELNQSFSFFAFWVGYWALNYACWLSSPSEGLAIFFIRNAMVGAIFIPSSFTHFGVELLGKSVFRMKIITWNYGLSVLFLLFSFSPIYISGVEQRFIFPYWPVPNILFHFMLAHFLLNIVYAHYILWKGMREAQGTRKAQIKYVFMGTLIGFIGGSTNYFVWYRIPIYPYLNLLVAIYVCTVAYAILRYRLLDIEVIIKKTLVFAGIVAASACAISLPIGLIQLIIGRTIGISPFWLMASGIVTTALIYRPLARWLVDLTDKYLFQRKVNYRKLLKEATEYLAHLKSLKWQARRIVTFLIYKARIANVSLYAYQSFAPGSLLLQASRPKIRTQGHKTIPLSHSLVDYMKSHRSPVELHLIEEAKFAEKDPEKINEFGEIIQLFKDHQAEAIIPCFGSDAAEQARRTELHLRGILFLGHQKSDEPYSEEDLDVFFTLGQESSIAFENARLYDEQIQRAHELERINEELNNAQTKLIHSLDETEKARKAEEYAKEEALQAKKKTEEMELELIRREKLLFVEQLVKGLAHEIFNPMTSFRMETERLGNIFKEIRNYYRETNSHISSESKESMETQLDLFRHSVNLLERTTDHVFRVVDNLYQMQKPDDQTIKPVDFKSYWAIAVPLIEAQSHGEVLEQVPIDSDGIQKNLFLVKGNGSQLTQVFLNLYRNALYAVKDKENKEIKIQADVDQEDNSFLKIIFEDNGTGIKPEVIPKIFDYMFTTKGEKGQGIGLNMCKNLIERFGGTITCESKIGEGTKFIIRLPFVREEMRGEIIQDS